MAIITGTERTKLYTRIRHLLGAPIRGVEIEDEMMDSLLELSVEDYSQYVLDWLIESNWVNLVNLNMSEKSVAQALITRTMNLEDQFSYSYSKIVGLQTKGPWVLKKDYFILSANTQTYEIPAGLLKKEGNVLAVYKDGGLVRDPYTKEKIELPSQRAGLLMVFRVFDKLSYGLILKATRPLAVMDEVRNP